MPSQAVDRPQTFQENGFSVAVSETLPRMAWLLTKNGRSVSALVGAGVATDGRGWFFEGGWAYTSHPKECNDQGVYMGSGVVETGAGSVTLIGPSHSIEGLYVSISEGVIKASNSLALLLAASGVDDVDAMALGVKLATVRRGLVEYEREIFRNDTVVISRYVHANVHVSGNGTVTERRQANPVEFETFSEYKLFLTTTILSVFETSQMTGYTVPLSKGYDSVGCAALAAELGGGDSLSLETARDGSDDNGHDIGVALGLRTHVISRPVRVKRSKKVAYKMFGGLEHEELIDLAEIDDVIDYYSGYGLSEEVLRIPDALAQGRVLLTGFHGDRTWGEYASNRDIVRGDTSGTGFVERRLKAGMVHVPVPMLGAQDHPAIRRLTYSQEMMPWRVGGNYDRPIPRRLAEELGVKRELFGYRKAAAATMAANREIILPALLSKQIANYKGLLTIGSGIASS